MTEGGGVVGVRGPARDSESTPFLLERTAVSTESGDLLVPLPDSGPAGPRSGVFRPTPHLDLRTPRQTQSPPKGSERALPGDPPG